MQGISSPKAQELQSRGLMFANEALQILADERQRPSITLLQGLISLWFYEVNYGKKAQAVTLLEDFYHFHHILGISDLVMPSMDDEISRHISPLKREWQALSCIVWGFFCLEA